jgi:hypothetical protein
VGLAPPCPGSRGDSVLAGGMERNRRSNRAAAIAIQCPAAGRDRFWVGQGVCSRTDAREIAPNQEFRLCPRRWRTPTRRLVPRRFAGGQRPKNAHMSGRFYSLSDGWIERGEYPSAGTRDSDAESGLLVVSCAQNIFVY